jgi:DNA-binding NarL/FixJ family response regulator
LTIGFPKVSAAALKAVTRHEDIAADPLSTTTVVARPAPQSGLSPRELEVLKSVAAGLSDKQVAGRLGISPKTVRNHLSQIFSKLQASNRVEAVINALKRGLLIV